MATTTTSTTLMGIKGFRSWFESTFPNAMMAPLIPSQGAHDTFDHVLIDMNQILHVVLRKSRSDGHALTLLMKELDAICSMATPTQSLVLAMDGPPAAAKLATQRRRRYSTIVKSEYKLLQLDKYSKRFTKAKKSQKIRRYQAEVKTLCITPGTEFMKRTEQALLYWAWQRLLQQQQHTSSWSNNNNNNNNNKRHNINGEKNYRSQQQQQQRPIKHGVLGNAAVKIYISPSSVPGEGEVKLLEWILQHPAKFKNGAASIAILGGDSDLVLEGLIVPPKWTHNVFVLLPEGSRHYIAVSLWETTRSLASQLQLVSSSSSSSAGVLKEASSSTSSTTHPPPPKYHVMAQVRNDFVLLLVFNGNDYLPKLRGSSGFNRVYQTYMKLMRHWLVQHPPNNTSSPPQQQHHLLPGLVDPDRLEFRIEFCIAFFEQLARSAPAHFKYDGSDGDNDDDDDDDEKEEDEEEEDLDEEEEDDEYDDDDDNDEEGEGNNRNERPTSLAQLHTMLDSGFLPQPMKWQVLRNYKKITVVGDDSTSKQPNDARSEGGNNDKQQQQQQQQQIPPEDQVMVRLRLGVQGSKDYFQFETVRDRKTSLKLAKQKLAYMALKEILEELPDVRDPEDDGLMMSEGPEEDRGSSSSITSSGYAWEIHHSVEADIEEYLAGLLWNLQTYQDGLCSDYAYNYGKRQSPTAHAVLEFFQRAKAENRTIGRRQLLSEKGSGSSNTRTEANGFFSPPVSAGLTCLAALPSQVKHLVPEPYQWLPDAIVEAFYSQCMDPNNNVFDLKNFERLCEAEIESIGQQPRPATPLPQQRDPAGEDTWSSSSVVNGGDDGDDDSEHGWHGRRIIMGDHYWTVMGRSREPLPHPFEPPLPFSDRLSKLRPDSRIRVSRLFATSEPRPRSVWMEKHGTDGKNDKDNNDLSKRRMHAPLNDEVTHSDLGSLLEGGKSIMEVEYKIAYQKELKEIRAAKNGNKSSSKKSSLEVLKPKVEVKEAEPMDDGEASPGTNLPDEGKKLLTDINVRMQQFQVGRPPKTVETSKDGQTAVAILKQLRDAGLVGKLVYTYTLPSTSSDASFDPENYEFVTLTVQRGKNKDLALLLPMAGDLVYEQDRHVSTVSRQSLKQHLGSLALCDLTGLHRQWSELTFAELKEHLIQCNEVHRNTLNNSGN
jgi:hypothetical protein